VTATPEHNAPEPTLVDVLAAIAALSTNVARIEAKGDQLRTEMNVRFDQVADKFELARSDTAAVDAKVDRVQADVAQVRADVLAVKVEHGFYERHQISLQTALDRHMQDPGGHSHAA
jgi:outer membrane murein-binding lipoprotein Lpp